MDEGGEGASYDDAPRVMLVADSAAGMARIRRAADAVRGRVLCEAPLERAGEELARRAAIDAAIVDFDRDTGALAEQLVAQLAAHAEAGRYRSVVSVRLDLLDSIEARCAHRDVALLCEPDDLELAAAVGVAMATQAVRLLDPTAERDETRLLRLSEEAGRIARALAELSQREARSVAQAGQLGSPGSDYRAEPGEGLAIEPDDIRAMIRLRRLRDRFFDGALFADPAWDMLLDLTAARLEGRQVSVSSLCIAAAVPPTTALRWIRAMTEEGLFVRQADPNDGRRIFIALGDGAAHAMEAWFTAARASEDLRAV